MTTVTEKVRTIISEALIVELDDVQENSNLMLDLKAESIDFLDIVFRLEEGFGIRIPHGDTQARAREGLAEGEFEVNGVLQPKGLERLRQLMPEVDSGHIKDGLKVSDIPKLFTVKTFVRMVQKQLGATAGAQESQTALAAA